MAKMETHFFSEVIGMDMKVNVILPQEKRPYTGDGKLKVLWLLHGGSGDDTAWLRMTNIERYALEYGIAVVVPGVFHSCFTDMAHGGRFFTYMTEELPHIIRHMFPRLSDKREDNFISGFSNGGYGCFRIGLARPDLYGAIGAFAAGDKSDVPNVDDIPNRTREQVLLWGSEPLKGSKNDLKQLGRDALNKRTELPHVYHACGSEDPWLGMNETMRDFFLNLEGDPYHYQYHRAESYGHNWAFCDMEIVRFFEYLGLEKNSEKYMMQ